jgi:hydrophobe/amphiphile efflux-3 (HAE3) family protein
MRELPARVAARCVERPAPLLAAAALAVLVAAVVALRLEADAGTDQLVDRDSATFVATERFKRDFGDDAVVVLVKGDLEQLVLSSDLTTLQALETCLAGDAGAGAAGQQAVPEPCARLAATRPARVVYGPATFLDQFASQAGRLLGAEAQAALARARVAGAAARRRAARRGLPAGAQQAAAEAAAERVTARFWNQLAGLAARYGQTGLPSISDPGFVAPVVFDRRRPGEPKARFSYLFPSAESALISVRLRPDLGDGERREAIEQIRAAVTDPAFAIEDADYVVSGVPVVVEGLAEKLSDEIFALLAVAVAVMAIVLTLVFGPPLRLLPLAIALAAAAVLFGGLAAFGGSLTMASLAVLPILVGLGVDYAIQFQARFAEARGSGSSAPRAAVEAAVRGGPVIATAAAATAAGFVVLLISPIPMVRGFGLLLLAGIAVAFCLALTVGLAALSLSGGPRPSGRAGGRTAGRPGSGAGGPFARAGAALEGARGRAGAGIAALGRRALALAVAAPGRVLVAGLILAVVGWAAATRTEVVSDIRELVPRDLAELRGVDELQAVTGVSGEIDVTVRAPDVTDPELVAWMGDYKRRVLDRAGFGGESRACVEQRTELCPSIALPDLFADAGELTAARVRRVLSLLPPYFSQAVVSVDPSSGAVGDTAVISFGIKVMPFDEQKRLIDSVRAEIDPPGAAHDPPEGVSAEVVGLPVLVGDANSALDEGRYLLSLAGLAAVALALLAIYRSLRRALVPLIPIALATGWSALGLAITGVPLNPMSATLGALVIAIATEFSVLIAARFEEERSAAGSIGEALRRAYARTGTAVVASGLTAIAGFAALIATDIRMLRDFGIVTVLDLSIALAGVLLLLPAALVWAESGFAPFGARGRVRTVAGPG